jgi:hypothetical protein
MWDFQVSLSSDQRALIENNGSVSTFQRTKEPWFKMYMTTYATSRCYIQMYKFLKFGLISKTFGGFLELFHFHSNRPLSEHIFRECQSYMYAFVTTSYNQHAFYLNQYDLIIRRTSIYIHL